MTLRFAVLFAALFVDRIVGDPDRLWRRVPHPVAGFGALIAFLDTRLNRDGDPSRTRRIKGVGCTAALTAGALGLGALLAVLFRGAGFAGLVIETFVVAVFLAQKSMADHVRAVIDGLRSGGLAGGRTAVAMIVGRDPAALDRPGVCRASIESLAENFADGVVAPALWYGILGLPGLLAYKMINTADSMIGHRSPRHGDFGRAAARLDDLVNWPAARLSALLIALAAALRSGRRAGRRSLETAMRDAGLHRSPNAGWPEAAMAGALGVALAGPRVYAGIAVNEAMINAAGRRDITGDDIDSALGVFLAACSVLAGLVFVCALLTA